MNLRTILVVFAVLAFWLSSEIVSIPTASADIRRIRDGFTCTRDCSSRDVVSIKRGTGNTLHMYGPWVDWARVVVSNVSGTGSVTASILQQNSPSPGQGYLRLRLTPASTSIGKRTVSLRKRSNELNPAVPSSIGSFRVEIVNQGAVYRPGTVTQGSGVNSLTKTSTGIYEVSTLVRGSQRFPNYGLFWRGQLQDFHTGKPNNQWARALKKNTRRSISTARVAQLIRLAGVNRNVESMSQSVKNQFYSLAGFSSSGTSPSSTEPTGGIRCPRNYQYNPSLRKCVPMSFWLRDGVNKLASLWNDFSLVPEAEARLIEMRFMLRSLVDIGSWGMAYDPATSRFGISFAGFSALFLLDDSACWENDPDPNLRCGGN